MSWSINGEVDTSQGDYDQELDNIKERVTLNETTAGVKEAQEEQVKWAIATLVDAIDCSVVGKYGAKFAYYIYGHANPNHEPREGWSPDSVTVQISRKVD